MRSHAYFFPAPLLFVAALLLASGGLTGCEAATEPEAAEPTSQTAQTDEHENPAAAGESEEESAAQPADAGADAAADTGSARGTSRGADDVPIGANPALASLMHVDEQASISDIAEAAVERVVNISTNRISQQRPRSRSPFGDRSPFRDDPFFREFERFFESPEQPRERRERNLGSGVIVSPDGVVLTNNHVVENADEIRVTLSDGTPLEAELLGADPPSDLAVLQLRGEFDELPWMAFGDSESLRLGEVVLAVGNPFGLSGTVTMGIVSAKGRANVGIVDYEDFIQTDASINPGNSGGALLNMRGELVGINTAILSRSGGYQGIGFAIPSNMAQSLMSNLLEHGEVVRGYLGVSIQDLSESLADALGVDRQSGVVVAAVEPESPAEVAGIRDGDVILRVNGETMRSSAQLRNHIALIPVGESAEVTLLRDGAEVELQVEIATRAEAEEALAARADRDLGMTLRDLDDEQRRQHRVPRHIRGGAVIVDIEQSSAAARAGLRPGDVIIEANREPVAGVADLLHAVAASDDRVLLRAVRRGLGLYVVVPLARDER